MFGQCCIALKKGPEVFFPIVASLLLLFDQFHGPLLLGGAFFLENSGCVVKIHCAPAHCSYIGKVIAPGAILSLSWPVPFLTSTQEESGIGFISLMY